MLGLSLEGNGFWVMVTGLLTLTVMRHAFPKDHETRFFANLLPRSMERCRQSKWSRSNGCSIRECDEASINRIGRECRLQWAAEGSPGCDHHIRKVLVGLGFITDPRWDRHIALLHSRTEVLHPCSSPRHPLLLQHVYAESQTSEGG